MDNYEPYEKLAHAIVLQASEDYRSYIKSYKELEKEGGVRKVVSGEKGKRTNTYYITLESIKANMRPLENFFRSEWGYQLSGIDGDTLIKKLWEAENE